MPYILANIIEDENKTFFNPMLIRYEKSHNLMLLKFDDFEKAKKFKMMRK